MKFAAYLLAWALVLLCLSMVVSLIFSAMASLIADEPGQEHQVTDLGHRAVPWTAALCFVGVAALYTIEQWWPA